MGQEGWSLGVSLDYRFYQLGLVSLVAAVREKLGLARTNCRARGATLSLRCCLAPSRFRLQTLSPKSLRYRSC